MSMTICDIWYESSLLGKIAWVHTPASTNIEYKKASYSHILFLFYFHLCPISFKCEKSWPFQLYLETHMLTSTSTNVHNKVQLHWTRQLKLLGVKLLYSYLHLITNSYLISLVKMRSIWEGKTYPKIVASLLIFIHFFKRFRSSNTINIRSEG